MSLAIDKMQTANVWIRQWVKMQIKEVDKSLTLTTTLTLTRPSFYQLYVHKSAFYSHHLCIGVGGGNWAAWHSPGGPRVGCRSARTLLHKIANRVLGQLKCAKS